ncbi:MAG: ACP S-malonyltransferase [Elusimicrobia bacterium]|nr:ACP S-malonyltransferase [Elusimicrobiota bacterium]
MKNYAFVFPGQGIQRVGMGREIYEKYPPARDVLDKAGEILGLPIKKIMFEGPAEELSKIYNTQIAIFLSNIMVYSAVKDAFEGDPLFVAGHSLGEYCAVYSAGCLSFRDALKIVETRGRIMDEFTPVGSMAAVLGADSGEVKSAAEKIAASGKFVEAVNFNSRKQTVIAGTPEGISEFKNILKARIIPLRVKGPFHSSLMKIAQEKFNEAISGFYFGEPEVPVISNSTGKPSRSSAEILKGLREQIKSPVLWVDTVEFMKANGVENIVECAEKSILSAMVKDIAPEISAINALSLLAGSEKN